MDDSALLHEYASTGAETAFAALVERHAGLVYCAARRQVRDPQLAEDVTQAVFILLARKARQVARHPGLSGWLLQTTRYTANAHIRAAVRRAHREQEAAMQAKGNDSPVWAQLEPHLDEAMATLGTTDRAVLALRYFENQTAAEIGRRLNLSENAANQRAGRALEKLRKFLAGRGVAWSATAIAGAVAAHSVQAAPPGMAKTILLAVATQGAAATSTLTLSKGALKIMAWTKAQTAIVGAILVAVTTYSLIQHQNQRKLLKQNESLQGQINAPSRWGMENQKRSNLLAQASISQAAASAKPNPLPMPTQAPKSLQDPPAAVATIPAISQTTNRPAIELPKNSWTNAGFATPQAALQTRGWAVLNGDRDVFQQSVVITGEARKLAEDALVKMAEASNDPNKEQYIQSVVNNKLGVEEAILMPMMALKNDLTGYKILAQQSPSANEMILEVETDMAAAPPQKETLNFQRFGNEWKVVYDKAVMQKMMQP